MKKLEDIKREIEKALEERDREKFLEAFVEFTDIVYKLDFPYRDEEMKFEETAIRKALIDKKIFKSAEEFDGALPPSLSVYKGHKENALKELKRDKEAIEFALKGLELYELGGHEEAIEYCNKAIKINPIIENAWIFKGYALDGLGRHEEAIECYDNAIKINPDNENAWVGKGYALEDLERNEEAIECYDKAIEINPNNENARNSKEDIINKPRRYEEAIEAIERYVKAKEIRRSNRMLW
jgi:tetratricopeptide (TPR) repeat protein